MDFLPEDITQGPAKTKVKPCPPRNQGGYLQAHTKQALDLVINNGVDEKRALQLVTGKEAICKSSVRNLKQHVARWSIERPAAQKIAHSTLLKFASGKDVNGIEPKATDVRACAERIVDQATPVTRVTQNLNVNVDIHPVDLAGFM